MKEHRNYTAINERRWVEQKKKKRKDNGSQKHPPIWGTSVEKILLKKLISLDKIGEVLWLLTYDCFKPIIKVETMPLLLPPCYIYFLLEAYVLVQNLSIFLRPSYTAQCLREHPEPQCISHGVSHQGHVSAICWGAKEMNCTSGTQSQQGLVTAIQRLLLRYSLCSSHSVRVSLMPANLIVGRQDYRDAKSGILKTYFWQWAIWCK